MAQTITSFSRARLQQLPASHPHRPDILHGLALSLAAQSYRNSNPAELDEAIKILRELLSTASQHPDYSIFMFNLADLLHGRFTKACDARFNDLEESIALHRKALHIRVAPHPDRSLSVYHLVLALTAYFRHKGVPLDFKEYIDTCREALKLFPPPHPYYYPVLSDLASALYTRFEREKVFEDLEESLKMYYRLLDMKPTGSYPDRSATLYNLANVLSGRFEQKGNLNDLNESIALYRKAVALQPPSHPDRWKSLINLGATLNTRFSHNRDYLDLDNSIEMFREVLESQPVAHPDRFDSLDALARALSDRFDQTGELQDLEDSMALDREALKLQHLSHSNRSSALKNLGIGLSTRFEQKSDIKDLEECISLYQEALALQSTHHLICSESLNGLAGALSARFAQTGDIQDIEDSISLHREALSLTPDSKPFHAAVLSNLACAITARFEHSGTFQDLEEIIALYRRVLLSQPTSHINHDVFLNNLAKALKTRFEQDGNPQDIEESILLNREALRLRPKPHPDRNVSLANLASTLVARFRKIGGFADLEEAITLHKEALSSLAHNHSDYLWSLRELGSALYWRYRTTNNPVDLEECISLYKRVLSLDPTPHPTRAASLLSLAFALHDRFRYSGRDADIKGALGYLEEASKCEIGFILHRFRAAQVWADYAARYDPASALDAYNYAITLLPLLASLDLTLQQRQDALRHSQMCVGRAVEFCITENQYEEAVVFLSVGRSVFWSQALQLRTSGIGTLLVSHPALAEEFTSISERLEQASYSGRRSILQPSTQETSLTTLVDRRHQILQKIRQITGFDRFLLPPLFSSLRSAATSGPLVLLNSSYHRCDALILGKRGSIQHVPLPRVDLRFLGALHLLLYVACSAEMKDGEPSLNEALTLLEPPGHEMPRDPDSKNPAQDVFKTDINSSWGGAVSIDASGVWIDSEAVPEGLPGRDMARATNFAYFQHGFRFVLWCLWKKIVQPIVEVLRLEKTDDLARIWWCPTGLFTFLPIHAAGIYSDENEPIDCLFQYAVSSYCTSPQDLLPPPPPVNSASGFKMTAIIEPEAPGSQALPATRKELQEIEKHARQCLITHVGSKETPTRVESLLSDIQQSSFVHFGCHGVQDLDDPLESYLLLSGGKLTMSRIMKECQVPEGALAYLSACETAKGDGERLDESLNLVATMMFAGFRSVIGTMWTILDEDAPIVADIFYGHLFRNGKDAHPDIRDAAYGLHLATKELRDQGKPFQSWVPYVHYGI